MSVDELVREIKNRRESGDSYQKIGDYFGLSRPVVRRLFLGEKPSRHLIEILKLDPPKKLQATRLRRSVLNKIAQYWKYKNWSDYETQILKDFDENFDWETLKWKDN